MVKIKNDIPPNKKYWKQPNRFFLIKAWMAPACRILQTRQELIKPCCIIISAVRKNYLKQFLPKAFEHLFPMLNAILESDKTVFEKIEMICVEYINQMQRMPYLPVFILSEANRQPKAFLKKYGVNKSRL